MTLRHSAALACVLLASAPPAAAKDSAAASFDVAITIDDLPIHGDLPPNETRLAIAQSVIATLKRHGVRGVYGFVNAAGLDREPSSESVLDAWRRAGHLLGNHGYAHQNLDKAPSIADWAVDVIADEPILARYMPGKDWHWYRFPNLSAGKVQSTHHEAATLLRSRGYSVASVSVGFGDWSYGGAYARCLKRGNADAIAAMKADYLEGVDISLARAKQASQRVYGRQIPQTVLLHIGAWTAFTLPEVLDRIEAAGGRYVSLAAAQRDPAYSASEVLLGGGSVVERTARSRSIDLGDLPKPASTAGLKQLCR